MAIGDPLLVRVLNAVTAAVTAASAPNVPSARVYRRGVLDYSPDRDKLPGVVVAPTPGRTATRRKLLSAVEVVYPVSAVLVDAAGTLAVDPVWRAGWADAAGKALHGRLAVEGLAADKVWAAPDGLTALDLSAWEAAGVWRAAVSVVVTCRVPLTAGV